MYFVPEDILKILLAILIGGLIGVEREYRDKAAGFRTIIFITVGATFFTILSLNLGGEEDPVRIASSVVAGVGFLGAGVILRDRGRIVGLTTAATIWLSAALGMGIGGGAYLLTGFATIAVLIVLWLFPRLEKSIDKVRVTRTYEIHCPADEELFESIKNEVEKSSLQISDFSRSRSGANMICKWETIGRINDHERLNKKLFDNPDIVEFNT